MFSYFLHRQSKENEATTLRCNGISRANKNKAHLGTPSFSPVISIEKTDKRSFYPSFILKIAHFEVEIPKKSYKFCPQS